MEKRKLTGIADPEYILRFKARMLEHDLRR